VYWENIQKYQDAYKSCSGVYKRYKTKYEKLKRQKSWDEESLVYRNNGCSCYNSAYGLIAERDEDLESIKYILNSNRYNTWENILKEK